MKPGNSKPKRSRTDKRSCRLAISVTPEEKNRIGEQASAVNLKVSEYLYCAVMNRKVRVEKAGFRQDLKNLASIANNLNQIAKAANKYGFLSSDDKQELAVVIADIYKTINSQI